MSEIATANRLGLPSRAQFETDLIREILEDELAPGQKLPSERAHAASSGLSRPIVREVLRSLAERGLIEIVPARGAFVRAPGSLHLATMMGSAARHQRATPNHLVQAREMIEVQTARSAAERATESEVDELRQLVGAFDRAPNVLDKARCDLALHASVARASGNPVLSIMFGAIAPMVLELMLRSLTDPVVLQLGGPMHAEIVDAIAERRADGAGDAMARHVTLARELYGSDLEAPLDELAAERLRAVLGGTVRLEDIIEQVLLAARLDLT